MRPYWVMRPFFSPLSPAGMALLGALVFQSAFPLFADGIPVTALAGAAFAARQVYPPSVKPVLFKRVDPATFNEYIAANEADGRVLTPAELADLNARMAKSPHASPVAAGRPGSASRELDSLLLDSLNAFVVSDSARVKPAAPGNRKDTLRIETRRYNVTDGDEDEDEDDPDTLIIGQARADETDNNERGVRRMEEEEEANWFVNLLVNFRDGPGGGGGGWNGDDLAAVIFVVVGVVVVGAFLIYGIQTLAELAINPESDPLFQEVGLRLSYSGHALRNGTTADLYADSYLTGLRYAIGFDRPGMDLGLSVEGGYIDVRLHEQGAPLHSFDFRGGYLVAGPLLRFGSFDPLCFSLEFLNGASTHQSIGWISKSRMTLQARVGRHATIGGHLGGVFYDLKFLDGLAWRRGDFNRDLSLILGVDGGWEF